MNLHLYNTMVKDPVSGEMIPLAVLGGGSDEAIQAWLDEHPEALSQAVITDYDSLKSQVNSLVVDQTTNLSGWKIEVETGTTTVYVDATSANYTFTIPLNTIILDVFYKFPASREIRSGIVTSETEGESNKSVYVGITFADPLIDTDDMTVTLVYTHLDSVSITELTDIRVGYDGTTYSTAGDAVRGQARELKSNLIPFPTNENPKYGTNGQLLRTLGNGTTEWVDEGLPTDEQTAEAINAWLNDHPEATTTVQDGSLTHAKLVKGTMGYITPEMFGAIGDGFIDDTEALQDAIDYGYANGKAVYLSGKYLITESIKVKGVSSTVSNTGTELIGNRYSHLIAGDDLTNIIETEPVTETSTYGIKIKDLILDGNNQVTNGIYSGYALAQCIFENITINQCTNGLHVNGNCYLNNFRNIRTYHCTDYGILLENGNNTSNIFEKCYVDTSENAFRINGQYSTMISCCADVISDTVFMLNSFHGSLIACGSESKTFKCMFSVSTNTNVCIVGGIFWGNPTLSGYYFDIGAGCRVNVYSTRLNYITTSDSSTGALCKMLASSYLNIRDSSIYKPFDTANSMVASARLFENTAVKTMDLSITLDENNEYDISLSPARYSVLDVYVKTRTGYVPIVYRRNSTTMTLKMMSRTAYIPTIDNKSFNITITYIDKSLI